MYMGFIIDHYTDLICAVEWTVNTLLARQRVGNARLINQWVCITTDVRLSNL